MVHVPIFPRSIHGHGGGSLHIKVHWVFVHHIVRWYLHTTPDLTTTARQLLPSFTPFGRGTFKEGWVRD